MKHSALEITQEAAEFFGENEYIMDTAYVAVPLSYQHQYGTWSGKVWREKEISKPQIFQDDKTKKWGFRATVKTIKGIFGVEKGGYDEEKHAKSAAAQAQVNGAKAERALKKMEKTLLRK